MIDGQGTFQICTTATGCRAGLRNEAIPGAIGVPRGVVVDRGGAVYVTEGEPHRIEKFGDPVVPPTVPPTQPPPTSPPPTQPPPNRPPDNPPPTSARSFRFLAVKLNPGKGTATLSVEVSQVGRVLLKGTEIPKAVRAAKGAGIVKLPVVPVREAKRKLSETGKVRMKVLVTFIPQGGAGVTKGKTLVLTKNLG